MPSVLLAAPLRAALLAADFTYDAVSELLGPEAHHALRRNETTPALRRTANDDSPLATLVRLFILQCAVSTSAAERALPGLLDRLAAADVVVQSVGEVAARLDVRPYATDAIDGGDLWVVSDLTLGMDGQATGVTGDYVLGISPASSSLARTEGMPRLVVHVGDLEGQPNQRRFLVGGRHEPIARRAAN